MDARAPVMMSPGAMPVLVEGSSPAMQAILEVVRNIAPTEVPILVVGESGTGKEAIALRIHRLSRRQNETFLKLRCSTLLPGSLQEAINIDQAEWADRGAGCGTLFLDEISELASVCQAEILRALANGGGTSLENPQLQLNARLICSTSRNLEEEVRAGRLLEELYYRINGVCLRLPPLRRCKEDIVPLLEFFLKKDAALMGLPQPVLSAETLRVLTEYSWPGNIRELKSVVKKIVAAGDDRAALAELGTASPASRSTNTAGKTISLKEVARAASRQAEREVILKVLARTRWNRKRAAQDLQISYKALLYKLKQIGLDDAADA